jgi:hypothetical protein
LLLSVFFGIEIDTLPLPLPPAPEVMVIHEVLLDAVQMQPLVVDTLMDLLPPSLPTFTLSGETENEHVGRLTTAAWLTVKGRPATVIVPLRAPPVLTATLNATDPLPVPLAPDVTVIHDAPLLADHWHPLCVVTAIEPGPPSAVTSLLVGAMV